MLDSLRLNSEQGPARTPISARPPQTGSVNQANQDVLRIVRMATYQASVNTNTRYRTDYRLLKEQFLTNILPSSTIGSTTIFPPHSGQSFTIEGRPRAEQWQQPSSSSPSVFDTEGHEWVLWQPDTYHHSIVITCLCINLLKCRVHGQG